MSDDKTHAAEQAAQHAAAAAHFAALSAQHAAQAAQFAAMAAGATSTPPSPGPVPGPGPGFQFPQMPNYGQSYGQPQQHAMTIPTWW